MKDYYLSRIRNEVRASVENEGIVRRRKVNEEQSSHLCLPSDPDESGMTPPRFQTEADEDVHLRRIVPDNHPSDTHKPPKNQGASLMGS